MKLDELVALIEALRQRAQAFASELYQGETLARYALIDPLLRALGWDTGDPSQVRPEYAAGNKKADYVLLDADSSPLILLEAKKLGDKLPSIAGAAVATYAMELANQGKRVKLLATTNGLLWELYDFPNMMQPRFSFDLRKGTAAEAAYKALGALWRPLLRPRPLLSRKEGRKESGRQMSSSGFGICSAQALGRSLRKLPADRRAIEARSYRRS
jgi:type I site-specific restriction endonuclease